MSSSPPFLILGACGSIGSSLARRLAARGQRVHIVGRQGGQLEQLAQQCGSQTSFSTCDFSQPSSIQSSFSSLAGLHPQVAAFAYCVGSVPLKPFARATREDFMEAYQLNVLGAVQSLQLLQPQLIAGRGSVLFFSSVAASHGFPNHAVIAAAKAAIEGLTKSLAAELSPHVRVNCIAPSLVRSKMTEKFFDQGKMQEKLAEGHPLKRLGEADKDIAPMAELLLTGDSWITGQIIGIDGGKSAIIK